jgi:hypothetical protein
VRDGQPVSRDHRAGAKDIRVVAGNDTRATVPQSAEAFGGAKLLGKVVTEGREPVIVEAGREVGDVGADDQILADAD